MSQEEVRKTWVESLKSSVLQSLANAPQQIGKELVNKFEQGEHELAAAIFHGSGFVMYPRTEQGKEQNLAQALQQPAPEQSTQQEMQQNRGGVSM